jgi:hypothetical protein
MIFMVTTNLFSHSRQFGLILLLSLGCSGVISFQATGNPDPRLKKDTPIKVFEANTDLVSGAKVIASGNLVNGEHPTTGRVQILQIGKKRILEFNSNFKTSTSGPDLVVVLHRSTDVIGSTVPPAYPLKSGDYILLAPLKSYSGAQRYPIPDGIRLSNYPSVAVWCRKFNATFGAARLK